MRAVNWRLASTLGPRTQRGSAANLEICRRLGATTYLSGEGARAYNDEESFKQAGVALLYHGFDGPRLSCVDWVMRHPGEDWRR